ncbi:phage/plasmid primase%2C P4 family%2C C-terminal domain [uncultured Clostridium sp.]|nr:phage/plasmid primase%2C P4 family%2C C-terminal domain [uncultured Clostridium sp.]
MKEIYSIIYDKYYPMVPGTKRPSVSNVNSSNSIEYSVADKLADFGATLKPGTMMIDIDDLDDAQLVREIIESLDLKCIIVETSRGYHFHFKANRTITSNKNNYYTPIGIHTETKIAHDTVTVPIKSKNTHRKVVRAADILDEFPMWLYPISKKEYIDFKSLDEHDGRNEALFTYILTLQSNGLTKEQIKESIKIINDFILKTPVEDRELETILRDDSFKKECFYLKGKLQYEKLARYLILEEHVIKINDQLHIYKDGVYTSNIKEIEKILLKYINNSVSSNRTEVIKYLEILAENKTLDSTKYVLLDNGILNLETKELLDYSPKYIIKNKIPHNYNPDAYHELLDKTLSKICCNNHELRLLMEEMIGYTLFRRNELRKCFILTGNGKNGKSTLLDILKELLGKENISSVSLDELNDRFKTFQLDGKLANIGDDISDKYIEDNSVFKKLVTGETVNVERKGRDPYDFENYSKLIFSCNNLPRINDLSDGLKSRLMFIPFNAKFSADDSDYDPFIKDKLMTNDSLEYLLKLGLDALNRTLYRKEFTRVKVVEDAWKEYERINNPILEFIEEHKIENESVNDVFRQYQVWCVESGLKAVSKSKFGSEIKNRNYNNDKRIRVDGKQIRIWSKNN